MKTDKTKYIIKKKKIDVGYEPDKKGSSEGSSELRPNLGSRTMLIFGPEDK